ncbi:MAG TPA: NAD(P)/FAD-dependent oxidoreductase, partial [Longimicrobiales bacterium]
FVILDAASRIGHAWRSRWDSLRLFTPARYSALPGLPFPGDPERFPTKDEVADYLERYAEAFDLPVRLGARVHALRCLPGAGFDIATGTTRYRADRVVVATGAFQQPFVPPAARGLAPHVAAVHSSEYRSPDRLPPGDALVVGAGNSGVQIAAELAATRRTILSVGARLPCLPERILGRSLFWWAEKTGFMRITAHSPLGRLARRRDLLIGRSPRMLARELGVRLVGRVERAEGDRVQTRDGEEVRVAAVVWATGYRADYRWIDAPVLDARGRPVHSRGVTPWPGLYFLGLPWQHTRGSETIGWVGEDAAYLADHMARDTAGAVPTTGAPAAADHTPAHPFSTTPAPRRRTLRR